MQYEAPIVWCWGNDANLANHVRRIYPMRFAGVFATLLIFIGFFAFGALAAFGTPAQPARVAVAAFQIVAWKASGGALWGIKGPALWAAMAPHGVGLVLVGKAIAAAALGIFAGWFAARGALEPRDGYRHIRGTRLYRGEQAKKILARQLGLKE